MALDYSEYLCKLDDGRVWWWIEDAHKLGAGYVPFKDNQRNLSVKLMPLDEQAQANRLTLMSALANSSILGIPLPEFQSRDEGRIVLACDYLRWLARYLALTEPHTQSSPSIAPSSFASLPPEFVAAVMASEIKKPNWSAWLTKNNTAPAWKACLLSLDIDPDGINPDNIDEHTYKIGVQHTQRDYAPVPDVNAAFAKRLRLLMESLLDEEDFPPPKGMLATIREEVNLSHFAAWCQNSHLDIPAPLSAIADALAVAQQKKKSIIFTHDTNLDAYKFFGYANVSPQDAATLLHGFNPNDDTRNPRTERSSHTHPHHFKDLLRQFEDMHATDPQLRTLRQWLDIARAKELMYHPWIDDYLDAKDEGNADGNSDYPKVAPAESKPQNQTPAERRKSHDITRERGCRRLILEHWDSIETLHGPHADGRQARNYILKKIDASERKPTLKTVQNHLAALRGEKLIP